MKLKTALAVLAILSVIITQAQTYVRGYTKKNGTYVAPHYRSSPNSTKSDNYSTKGNYNPYTGKPGTKRDDTYSYPSYSTPSYEQESAPSYKSWDSYTVADFYTKIELPYGTLDANGNEIRYVYKKADTPKIGKYEVSISDSDGDLYEIVGTDYYITFRSIHGYAGYAEEGILSIESSYYTVYYKKP